MKTILVDAVAEAKQTEERAVERETQQANLDALEESVKLPEKYKGKTVEELAKMHMDAEKEKSRIGNELGEVRRLADQAIRLQLAQAQKERPAPASKKELTAEDLLESPEKAITEAIASHPSVKRVEALEAHLLERETQKRVDEFSSKHPDYKEVGNSEEFKAWVAETPGRQKLYNQAAFGYDFDVADELLTQFKGQHKAKVTEATKKLQKDEIKAKIKDATLETATTGDASKKVFRRRDLLDMMLRDRDRYYDDNFQAELQQAYRDGRVK